jgi:hypothetical protein
LLAHQSALGFEEKAPRQRTVSLLQQRQVRLRHPEFWAVSVASNPCACLTTFNGTVPSAISIATDIATTVMSQAKQKWQEKGDEFAASRAHEPSSDFDSQGSDDDA